MRDEIILVAVSSTQLGVLEPQNPIDSAPLFCDKIIPQSSIFGMVEVSSWFCSRGPRVRQKVLKTLHFVKWNVLVERGLLTPKVFGFV